MSAFRPIGLLVATLLILAGCQGEEQAAAEAPPAPPPPEVGIIEAQTEALPVISELPGRIAPTRIAEVRARVGGIVLERIFEQGTDVAEGDPLFRIDPATFEVAVQAAEASVARAEAVLAQAATEASRTQTLVQSNTVSAANLDAVVALQRQAEADVASARANLRSAQINVDYATVRAPISGRIGRALITEGALVSATGPEALATIQQLDPVYADIQQPVTELLRLREALEDGTLTEVEPDVAQVRLLLDDGSTYPLEGRLLFSEATVDPASGQVTLRAEFPNPDDSLIPGMYVRVAIEQGVDEAAFAVPNQSIQRDSAGRSLLYIVNAENVVEARPVTVTRVVGDRTVVDSGLEEGERVIADGFQRTGPGAPVAPVPWMAPGAETPSAETAPQAEAPDDGTAGADLPADGAEDANAAPAEEAPADGTPVPVPAPREAAAAPQSQPAE